jgi:hypothetical protein
MNDHDDNNIESQGGGEFVLHDALEWDLSENTPHDRIVRKRLPTAAAKQDGIEDRFQHLAEQWKKQARGLSDPAEMAMLRSYQSIIGMGTEALPLILDELRRAPAQWFWALEAITGENPVPPQAKDNLPEMARAWLEWGQKRGIPTR